MNWNAWIRQLHRWLSLVFTATVIANFVQLGMGKGNPPNLVMSGGGASGDGIESGDILNGR